MAFNNRLSFGGVDLNISKCISSIYFHLIFYGILNRGSPISVADVIGPNACSPAKSAPSQNKCGRPTGWLSPAEFLL